MLAFLIRRCLSGLLVLAAVLTVVFFVTRVIGDPLATALPIDATAEQRAAFAHRLGLDRPLPVQFAAFLGDLARLDLGVSLWQDRSVTPFIFERLPNTLLLVTVSMALAIVVAVPLGILAALRQGRLMDRIVVGLSLIGLSVPQFWLGLIFIILFAVHMGLVPTSGSGTALHLVLPALTLALPALTRILVVTRAALIDEMEAQYIRVQIAKGMPMRIVIGRHALRNIAAPLVTLAGWEFIRNLAGLSVVVETLFAWPGLGLLAMQAVSHDDLTLLQGIVFYVALMVVFFNLLIDLAQKAIDPRIERL